MESKCQYRVIAADAALSVGTTVCRSSLELERNLISPENLKILKSDIFKI